MASDQVDSLKKTVAAIRDFIEMGMKVITLHDSFRRSIRKDIDDIEQKINALPPDSCQKLQKAAEKCLLNVIRYDRKLHVKYLGTFQSEVNKVHSAVVGGAEAPPKSGQCGGAGAPSTSRAIESDKQKAVYKITCKACKPEAVFIGMCTGVPKKRFDELVRQMKRQKQGPLGTHVKKHHGGDPQEFDFEVLGECTDDAKNTEMRKKFKSQYAAARSRW